MARVALLAGAAVALGLLLAPIPNLELVTASVALAGWLLGPARGGAVGALAYVLFGALNPMGSSLAVPPLWAAQILAMAGTGLLFGLFRRPLYRLRPLPRHGLSALLGAVATAFYQLLVNLASFLFLGGAQAGSAATLAGYLAAGFLFSAGHLISNTLLFATVVPPAALRLSREHPESA